MMLNRNEKGYSLPYLVRQQGFQTRASVAVARRNFTEQSQLLKVDKMHFNGKKYCLRASSRPCIEVHN
jgi:hypothetical protein